MLRLIADILADLVIDGLRQHHKNKSRRHRRFGHRTKLINPPVNRKWIRKSTDRPVETIKQQSCIRLTTEQKWYENL